MIRTPDYNAIYRKRLGVSVLAAAGLLAALFLIMPANTLPEWRDYTSFDGALEILPVLDLPDPVEATQQKTAAEQRDLPADFEAVEFAWSEPTYDTEDPTLITEGEPSIPSKEFQPAEDSEQTAETTTAVPVLAATDVQVLHFERPVYPDIALRQGIEGMVTVYLFVGTDGKVQHTRVGGVRAHFSLEEAAVKSLSRTIFRPLIINGTAQAFWVPYSVDFHF